MSTAPVPDPYEMRDPCRHCGHQHGYITPANGQDVVRCTQCNQWAYNAPKAESGKKRLTLTDRQGVTPSTRARILREWDNRCFSCGTEAHQAPGGLHLGHLIDRSLADRYGLLDELIDDPVNLVPQCATCNLGEAHLKPRPMRLIVRALLVMHRHQRSKETGE